MTRLTSLTVILPTEFTAARHLESGRHQRMFLTRRHATRMTLPPVVQARRSMQTRATRYSWSPGDVTVRSWDWSALSSVLLMVAIVALACAVTGVRL